MRCRRLLYEGVEEVAVEYAEVQFALLEEPGDVVRISVEVVDLFQDFWLEFVIGGDVPSSEYPRCWRMWVLLEALDGAVVPIAEVRREVVVAEQAACLHLLLKDPHLRMVCSRFHMFQVVHVP